MDTFNNDNVGENVEPNSKGSGDRGLSQAGLLEMVLRHRWLIICTITASLIAAYFYLLTATPIYTSSARLYVEQSGPKIISEYEGFMTGSKNYLYTQKELIKSTPLIAGVVKNPQIRRFKTFTKIDNLVKYIKNSINVEVGKKDDIITISFDCPYPEEAAQLVNSVIDSYVEYHSTHKRSTVLEVLKILQKEKVNRDQELKERFQEMLEFTKENGMLSFEEKSGGHIAVQRLSKLSEALTEAQLATINARAEYEVIAGMVTEPAKIKQFAAVQPSIATALLAKNNEAALESQLGKLETELEDLQRNYTEDHPAIQSVESQIKRIKKDLGEQTETFAKGYVEIMKQKYLTAMETEDELLKNFNEQREATQDIGVKNAEYSILNSELKRTERLCDILDERIKELNITEDTGALNISILEVARIEDRPSKPQKAKVMALAFILGLMLSGGLVFVREQFDCRLRSTEEISEILGVPILGIVPSISGEHADAKKVKDVLAALKITVSKLYEAIRITISSAKAKSKTLKMDVKDKASKAIVCGNYRNAWLEFKSAAVQAYQTIVNFAFRVRTPIEAKTFETGEDKEETREYKTLKERGQKVHRKPKSAAAEAYRTIRTSIFFGVPKGRAKTILITSPTQGDGKSTLVSNLALSMAQAGQKTIVLDCDFRRPIQHKIFGVDNENGLSNAITGNITLNEAIEQGPIESLHILPRGTDVPNPSELLNSDAFLTILNELCERYDRIVIDSPPVMPVADSQILGAICDVTILVLRAEKSTRKPSQLARDGLINVGSHLLGFVVNAVPQQHGRYGYYSRYYGYGYGYGYGHDHSYYDDEQGKEEKEKGSKKTKQKEKAYA